MNLRTATLLLLMAIGAVVCQSRNNEQVRTEVRNGVTITTRTTTSEARALAQPIPHMCDISRRPKTMTFKKQRYYFSWAHNKDVFDWLGGRNWCRERCMDLVSIETKEENNMIKFFVDRDKVKYIWTGGRLCDFGSSCNRPDLQPIQVNGWYWAPLGSKMPPTNKKDPASPEANDWSHTGRLNQPQPDNRAKKEGVGVNESCMSVMNNIYNDGVSWHDVACHFKKPIICEDSPRMLNFVKQKHGIKIE